MDLKSEPTPFDQKLFLVFVVTFSSMIAFEFVSEYLFSYPSDWRMNLITSLFVSGLGVIVAYFPLNSYYLKNVQVLSEIEKRCSIERDLRESESRLNSIIRLAPIGIGFEFNSILLEVNDKFCTITGYTKEELKGKFSRILYPSQGDYDYTHKVSRAQIAQKGFGEVETKWQRKDRTIIDVQISSTPVYPLDLSSGITFTVQDITKRNQIDRALRESENKFATVFRSSPLSLTLVSTLDETFIDVNDAFLRSTGYSRDEVIGKTIQSLRMFASDIAYDQMASALRAQGRVYGMEIKCRIKNGEIRTCLFSSNILVIEGRPYVLSNAEDITERRALESAYQALVRSMVGTTGLNSFQKITENISSWLGADCVIIGEILPDNETVNALSLLLDGKEIPDFSFSLKGTPSGKVAETGFCLYADNVTQLFPESKDLIKLHIRGYVGTSLRNSAGQVFGILSIFSRNPIQSFPSMKDIMDIIAVKVGAEIERSRMEQSLKESEGKFRMVVENSLDGTLIVTLDGVVLFRNRAVANIFGFESVTDRLGTSNVFEYVAPESHAQVLHDLSKVAQGIDNYPTIYQAITATGRRIWIESIGKRIHFQNSPAILVSMRDISSRKRMEEAIMRANKHLNLLSSITRHDINNQLLALNASIELLQMKLCDTSLEDDFLRLTKATNQITSMIRFAKEYEEIGVHAPVWQDLQILVNSAGKGTALGEVKLNNDIAAGTEVFADALIVKVFFNLIDNALRHGGKPTAIRFSFNLKDKVGLIICEDDGDGIVSAEKEKIFDRGFGKNTGFGLALSREILDFTGITITENGEPGLGARFEIIVPEGAFRINAG